MIAIRRPEGAEEPRQNPQGRTGSQEAVVADNDIVILSAVRTAQGRFQGGFAGTPASTSARSS